MLGANLIYRWKHYREDYGLTRVISLIILYNTTLFFLSLGLFHQPIWPLMIPVSLGILFYLPNATEARHPLVVFFMATILLVATMIINYYMVGEIDKAAGGLTKLDQFFSDFDNKYFGNHVANWLSEKFTIWWIYSPLLYNTLMFAYISYFILPIYGGILYYFRLPLLKRHRIGRYFTTFLLYYFMNFTLYLLVPVMGPQHFHPNDFMMPLPLTSYALDLYNAIQSAQAPRLDCFPSGHSGIAFMVTIWFFRMKHPQRYIIMVIALLIVLATLSLRYHYTLDIVASIPLVLVCYQLGHLFYNVDVYQKPQRT